MESVITDVIHIIEEGRLKAYRAINTSMVEAYWFAGKRIVEDELEEQDRAEYGQSIIKKLSDALSVRFGSGYSLATLYNYKQFYTTFPDEKIFYTLCRKLSWSHNRAIMRVLDENARIYYLKEASEQNWGVRQLESNINTLYYQRLLSSQNTQTVEDEMLENTKELKLENRDFIRNPTAGIGIASSVPFGNTVMPIPTLLKYGPAANATLSRLNGEIPAVLCCLH